ncbi:hypothetical protein CEUSTIGMA_g4753.t1 [Chlamydomonas eustigma]|uniref:Uncharacterized protein n=1 Tax=Chlamydomonas eustigma TaxID=1157962 RepID=A0A250X2K7_9CHLO|nr:hypothetical protein CEUSTIGMA_g4753.t1 [Chlamydomonas eustigma]|eukprot:GAX77307.1 hypothetical protein CEUSTIGMA_g4753.t1 [Chlamydomonas eustigma]
MESGDVESVVEQNLDELGSSAALVGRIQDVELECVFIMSAIYLGRWLLIAASLRIFSVWIGFFSPVKFQIALFRRKPEVVTEAFGRLFGTWTLVTCLLCVICAFNINNEAIYGATLGSFVIAFLYMVLELAVYKTIDMRGAISPMLVAGISIVWMSAGYSNYLEKA